MNIIISSLILILALHFLLQGLEYRKHITLENFCDTANVQPANTFISDKNDVNFQSNVLNLNRFYKKNIQDEHNETPRESGKIVHSSQTHSNMPNTWKYQNELVINGGELMKGVTGFDTLTDAYSDYSHQTNNSSCSPSLRGGDVDDDIRMGMGKVNYERRMTT